MFRPIQWQITYINAMVHLSRSEAAYITIIEIMLGLPMVPCPQTTTMQYSGTNWTKSPPHIVKMSHREVSGLCIQDATSSDWRYFCLEKHITHTFYVCVFSRLAEHAGKIWKKQKIAWQTVITGPGVSSLRPWGCRQPHCSIFPPTGLTRMWLSCQPQQT